MADLKRQLDELRAALESLPESATASQIAQLENEARTPVDSVEFRTIRKKRHIKNCGRSNIR